MWLFWLTLLFLSLSFFMDQNKTKKALKIAFHKFIFIAPSFLVMLMFVSLALFVFPSEKIIEYLGQSNLFLNTILAALIGSITIMPGFVVFPLAGIMKNSGVLLMVIAAFTTTLMMVGVLTFPVEITYFGKRIAFIRNMISFIIAILVAIVIGIYFKEIFV